MRIKIYVETYLIALTNQLTWEPDANMMILNLTLFLPYYAEVRNEFAVPISAS